MTTIGSNVTRINREQVLAKVSLSEIISQTQEVKRDGREFVTLCPFHADTNPSLHINDEKGFAYCHPCGKHVNAIDWLIHTRGVDFKTACKLIDESLPDSGVVRPKIQRKPKQIKYETFPAPPTVRPPEMTLKDLGQPTATWPYRDRAGTLIGFVARYQDVEGDKTIRTWTWGSVNDRRPEWHCMRWQRPYPLYGLEKLDKPGAEDKRIVLVSGEKTADAVQELMPESIVMTWCGGDDSARYADLEPIAGRANVILWRDADESGRRAEEVLAAELGPMVGNLFLVNVDDMPKAWDGADARDDGWSESRLRAWLQELLPVDEMPRLRRHGPRPASLVKPAPIADPTADEDREEKPPTAAAEFGMDSQHWRAQPWRHFLILGGEHNDRILNNDHNAAVPLRFAEELRGLIRYNEVTGTPTVVEPLPWGDEPGEWRDDHTTRLSQWLNRIGIMTPRDMLRNAVEAVARERSFNPIRDYLRSLQWDGMRRLDGWLPRYAGAVDSPYHREIGARWLISAVARGLKPGTQVDTMLVLEGAEGRGKTSLLRTLGREWFTPLRGSISAADGRAALQASTCWIVEFGELAATRNADWESLKDFLTTTDEVLRRPYAHSYERVHRLAVFAGTVNGNDWLPPDGDHRRFWPVAVGRCDVAGLAEVRDQLFAEAVVEYDAGRVWWIREEEEELVASVRAQREARKSRDEWIDLVLAWLDRPENTARETFAMHEITHKAIGVDHAKLDKSIQMRMGRVLAGCGMMRVKARDERGMPTWRWARPDAEINRRE